jgi:hypothetical protein
MLEFGMLPVQLTWSLICVITNSWMEWSMLTFPQRASGSTYIHVELVPDLWNFKLKKQVELTTVLPKELDSTMKEVEFWQEKYEEAIKTIRKLKHHCPQD